MMASESDQSVIVCGTEDELNSVGAYWASATNQLWLPTLFSTTYYQLTTKPTQLLENITILLSSRLLIYKKETLINALIFTLSREALATILKALVKIMEVKYDSVRIHLECNFQWSWKYRHFFFKVEKLRNQSRKLLS